MREQRQKIEIYLLDLRKFVGVERFLIIDTVFGNKNTYNSKSTPSHPGLNLTFHPSLFKAFRWWEHRFSLNNFSPAYYYMNAWKRLLFSSPLL